MTWEEWLKVKNKYPMDKLKFRQTGKTKMTTTLAIWHSCQSKEEFDLANKELEKLWEGE